LEHDFIFSIILVYHQPEDLSFLDVGMITTLGWKQLPFGDPKGMGKMAAFPQSLWDHKQ
jgi:hypothetical protein